ncbi:MAG: hypothetical protein AB1916_07125 [Thermodesulfobacteriota bacterium]
MKNLVVGALLRLCVMSCACGTVASASGVLKNDRPVARVDEPLSALAGSFC